MINLPASQLTHKLTRNEKENVQSMAFYNKHQYYLNEANNNKKNLIFIRKKIKSNNMDSKNLAAALELEIIFKSDAIENWNNSQTELKKYNDFEINRKYKN